MIYIPCVGVESPPPPALTRAPKAARPAKSALTQTGNSRPGIVAIADLNHSTSSLPPHYTSPSHPELHQRTIAIFKNHNVPYLLDASLAREHLDSSSAASERKVQSFDSQPQVYQRSIHEHTSLHRQHRQEIGYFCDITRESVPGCQFNESEESSARSHLKQNTRVRSPHAFASSDNAHHPPSHPSS